MRLTRKLAPLAWMGFDVDGVLTDGSLVFGATGDELKVFNSLDGHGIKLLLDAGIGVGIISGRRSEALAQRAKNLGITDLHMGVGDKLATLDAILAAKGLTRSQAGYMGDDTVDLPILTACGFSATVADGHPTLRRYVDYVTRATGGRGAVREVCDLVLAARAKGRA